MHDNEEMKTIHDRADRSEIVPQSLGPVMATTYWTFNLSDRGAGIQ